MTILTLQNGHSEQQRAFEAVSFAIRSNDSCYKEQ